MSKVKDLWVKVTYEVRLGDLEIPKEVKSELKKAYRKGREIQGGEMKYVEASNWLSENIKERDSFEWKVEIEELI